MGDGAVVTASGALDAVVGEVQSGVPPPSYPYAASGQRVEHPIRPGEVVIFAGQPGCGKTTFCMQSAFECLRFTPGIRVLVCNVEMAVSVLIMRLLSYLSGVPLTDIMQHQVKDADKSAFEQGVATFRSVADRLAFLTPPYTIENVVAGIEQFSPHIILLDYLQRFGLGMDANPQSDRQRVNVIMEILRGFADAGLSVVAVSALSRGKGEKGGSNYKSSNISMANLRESAELEYGADSVMILSPNGNNAQRTVHFKHEKSRNGECKDMTLVFDGRFQRFSDITAPSK